MGPRVLGTGLGHGVLTWWASAGAVGLQGIGIGGRCVGLGHGLGVGACLGGLQQHRHYWGTGLDGVRHGMCWGSGIEDVQYFSAA